MIKELTKAQLKKILNDGKTHTYNEYTHGRYKGQCILDKVEVKIIGGKDKPIKDDEEPKVSKWKSPFKKGRKN